MRLNVLPLLEQINPSVTDNICKTARYMQEAEKVVDAVMDQKKSELIESVADTEMVSIQSLLQLPSPELFLHEWLAEKGFNTTLACRERFQYHSDRTAGRAFGGRIG